MSNDPLRLRALAELQLRTRRGEVRTLADYQYDPVGYMQEMLKVEPWSIYDGGTAEELEEWARLIQPYAPTPIEELVGQTEVIDAYTLALRQQHEKFDWENGDIAEEDLQYWTPGETIKTWISVDAGHNVGKTFLAGALVNHFIDTFTPSIIYTYAPTREQIKDLLWKEIKTMRREKGLPGRILEMRLEISDEHFAKGQATDDSKGTGTEKAHGQHQKYQMFVIDEAEGVFSFVYDAIQSMASGGIAHVVLVLRNPRTRLCRAHKIRELDYVRPFRISCFFHPNIIRNRAIIPESVKRDYISNMLENTEIVEKHSPDDMTFELPWEPGTIYKPIKVEFLWRVFGVPGGIVSDNTFCPVLRYQAAKDRERPVGSYDPTRLRVGIDMARYGNDYGKMYVYYRGAVWLEKEFHKAGTLDYLNTVREFLKEKRGEGVTNVQVRVDNGGGYGSGLVDSLRADGDLQSAFAYFSVVEVNNGAEPYAKKDFYDLITELYYHAGEALTGAKLVNPPDTLESDLCERYFTYAKKNVDGQSVDVKRLVSKEVFRNERKKVGINRSPDDGDGLALAVAPDYCFNALTATPVLIELF